MKRLACVLGIFALAVFTQIALADNTVAFGSLTTVSNTTANSSILQTNTAIVSVGSLVITTAGLHSTNEMNSYRTFSLDGVNWVTNGTIYSQSTTNAGTGTLPATALQIPIYMRQSVTTTGSVNFGSVYSN